MRTLLLAPVLLLTPLAAQNGAIRLATGTDAHFDVPYDPLEIPPTGITVEAWITYDDSTIPTGLYYWPTIARQNVAPGGESWFFRVGASNTNNTSLEFAVKGNTGLQLVNYIFSPGQFLGWTHVAGTYDGSTLAIYVNGTQMASRPTNPSNILDNGGVLRVGNGDVSAPGQETWNGDIDELRLWPFARTGAEITSTMNDELSAIPAGVLTFNLNNTYVDSSAGLTGTPTGPIQFVTSSQTLTPRLGNGLSVGQSSSNCGAPRSAYGSLALVGNQAFSLVGTQGPANAAGTVLIGTGLRSSPLSILGILVHADNIQVGITVPTGSLGNARAPLGIPNNSSLSNVALGAQWVYLDAACGAQGLTASDGLAFVIQ